MGKLFIFLHENNLRKNLCFVIKLVSTKKSFIRKYTVNIPYENWRKFSPTFFKLKHKLLKIISGVKIDNYQSSGR